MSSIQRQKAEKYVREKLNINPVLIREKPRKQAYERSIRNALLGVFGQQNSPIVQSIMKDRPYQYDEFRRRVVDAKANLLKNQTSVLQKVRRQLQQGKGQKIAQGSIGSVMKIVMPDGKEYVVKKRHATQSAKQIKQFNNQAQMNQVLGKRIDIIPKYYGKTTVDGVPYMVFEKMDGDLVSLLGDDRFLLTDVSLKNDFVKQLRNIYISLQEAGICHGDLHEGNIYYKEENGKFRFVIGDFGKSTRGNKACGDQQDIETLIAKVEAKHLEDIKHQQLSKSKQLQKQQFHKTMRQFKQKGCFPVMKHDATQQAGDWGQCRCGRQQIPSKCKQVFASICAQPQFYSKYDIQTELQSCRQQKQKSS